MDEDLYEIYEPEDPEDEYYEAMYNVQWVRMWSENGGVNGNT